MLRNQVVWTSTARRLATVPIVISMFALSMLAVQASAATLEEVIANHIEARGGANWDGIRTMQISGSYTAFSETHPFTVQRKRDRKYLLDLVMLGSQQQLGFDGETAWSARAGDPSLMQGLDRSILMRDVDFATPLFDYEERGFTAKLLGEVDFDAGKAIGIELVRPDESVETWYLDPVTFLERGAVSPATDYLGETRRTTYFDDFRDVEGVKVPFYAEAQWLTRNRVVEVDEVVTNVEIDDAAFVMPPPLGMASLQSLAGSWVVTVAQRRGPEDEWQESNRESTIEPLMRGGLIEERLVTEDGTPVVRTLSYDKFNKRYRVTQIDGRNNHMDIQEGVEGDDGRILVSNLETGTARSRRGTPIHGRIAFFDIEEDSFKIEYETSSDGGESWFLGQKAEYARKSE